MRRSSLLCTLVGVLLVLLPLSAAEGRPFSVGIITLQEAASPYLGLVVEAGSVYASTFLVPSEEYTEHLLFIQRQARQQSKVESISSAYASKSEKALKEALEVSIEIPTTIADRLQVTYKTIPLQKGYPHLLATFAQARLWFASQEQLDALLMINQTKIASKDRIRLYWYDRFSDTTELLFDQVVVKKDPSQMQEDIGRALLAKSAGPEYSLLMFDGYTSSLTIEVNGESLSLQKGEALLPSGEYTLSIKREGYLPKQMDLKVEANSITHIPTTMQRIPMGDMLLSSSQGSVKWFVDGVSKGKSSSLSISSSLVPLVVVAQKEGFSSKTLQIQKPVKTIEVPLQPGWMTSPLLLQDRQKDFYASLRNSMLFFGLYVASSTLSQTFGRANPLWQPLQVASSGFALVSTLHTIMNLASYVALASSGVR